MILMVLAILAAVWITITSAMQWLSLPPSPMQVTPEEAAIVARMGIVFLGCAIAGIVSGLKE